MMIPLWVVEGVILDTLRKVAHPLRLPRDRVVLLDMMLDITTKSQMGTTNPLIREPTVKDNSPLILLLHLEPSPTITKLVRPIIFLTRAKTDGCQNSDLIKYNTPFVGPRIQLMLKQLEFKLKVEKQYKDGIEKMVRLYQLEGDRKSRADAEARRVESTQKIQLLKQALKRYENLHVDMATPLDSKDGLLPSS